VAIAPPDAVAPVGGGREPLHVPVAAFRNELQEPCAGRRDGIGPGNRHRIETVRLRGIAQRRPERCGLVQKSRSAYVFDGAMPACSSTRSGRNEGRDFTRAYQFLAVSSSFHGTSPK
jgi:hypothetical protein